MDSENFLNLGAIIFELGVPVAAIVAWLRVPRFRNVAAMVLGAVTPLLIAYVWVSISFLIDPIEKDYRFAFYAMWTMSFFAYVLLVIVGFVLAMSPRPSNPFGRFAVGLALGPASYALLSLVS